MTGPELHKLPDSIDSPAIAPAMTGDSRIRAKSIVAFIPLLDFTVQSSNKVTTKREEVKQKREEKHLGGGK